MGWVGERRRRIGIGMVATAHTASGLELQHSNDV